MKPLAPKQRAVLDFIVQAQSEGYTPTVREIMEAMGWTSPNAAAGHLTALEKNGYIQRDRLLARRITVLETGTAETAWGRFPL